MEKLNRGHIYMTMPDGTKYGGSVDFSQFLIREFWVKMGWVMQITSQAHYEGSD